MASECARATDSCESQDSKLNSVYTVSAVLCNFFTLIFGYLMDRFGTWKSRFLACLMVTGGSGLLAFATAEKSYLAEYGMYSLSTGKALSHVGFSTDE